MELVPWTFIVLASLLNVVLIGLGVWFAWVLVTSVRGIHHELARIREVLTRQPQDSQPGR